jgi:outer membrane protein OmpA-like peptidoglycan-associated protein
LVACASAERAPCPALAWEGECVLQGVTKVQERELPVPYVTYEAVYAPQRNDRYPQLTPGEARVRMGALAKYEGALNAHFKSEPVVKCHSASMPDACLPRDPVVDVKPFDAERAASASDAAPLTVGCAAIDASSEQDRLSRSSAGGTQIGARFQFGADSAALASDAKETANAVAKRLAETPTIECVGVVGQISSGESIALAEARARAVKDLLVSLGVDSKRLTTIALNANVYGQGAKAAPVDPTLRRVSLSVLLETALKPSP